jgi:hypothetical protein
MAFYRGSAGQSRCRSPGLSAWRVTITADRRCIHHQARGQTLMPCRPHCRQRHIWAYQPAPNSSKPSCAVSSPQSRQKRRNRSGWSPESVAVRRPRSDPDDQSPRAANKSCKRFTREGAGRIPPTEPLRCGIKARPTRSSILRRVKGRAVRAIIVSSNEAPISLHQPCQPRRLHHPMRSGAQLEIRHWHGIGQLHRP